MRKFWLALCSVLGLVLSIVGLAGIPDDLRTWGTWGAPLVDVFGTYWSVRGGCATVGVLLFGVVIWLFAVGHFRPQIVALRADAMEANALLERLAGDGVPVLSEPQRAILAACEPREEGKEYHISFAQSGATLDDELLKSRDGSVYVARYVISWIEALEGKGILEIVHDGEYSKSFELTPLGCQISLRD